MLYCILTWKEVLVSSRVLTSSLKSNFYSNLPITSLQAAAGQTLVRDAVDRSCIGPDGLYGSFQVCGSMVPSKSRTTGFSYFPNKEICVTSFNICVWELIFVEQKPTC